MVLYVYFFNDIFLVHDIHFFIIDVRFLVCIADFSGHPTCLQFTGNMMVSVRKYPWQCIGRFSKLWYPWHFIGSWSKLQHSWLCIGSFIKLQNSWHCIGRFSKLQNSWQCIGRFSKLQNPWHCIGYRFS